MKALVEYVKEGKTVKFAYYRENTLWYETDCGFIFPVPLSDTGTATFPANDKAIMFMRWIRKYRDEMIKEEDLRNVFTGNDEDLCG